MCRVVYIPGPLDPVMPSILFPRRRASLTKNFGSAASTSSSGSTAPGGVAVSRSAAAKLEEELHLLHEELYREAIERGEGGQVQQQTKNKKEPRGGGGRGSGGLVQLTPTSKNLFRSVILAVVSVKKGDGGGRYVVYVGDGLFPLFFINASRNKQHIWKGRGIIRKKQQVAYRLLYVRQHMAKYCKTF